MKRVLVTILVLTLLLNTAAFASETSVPEFVLGEDIQYHLNEGQKITMGEEFPVGTIKVEDVLYSETNREEQSDKEFADYMNYSATLVKVITITDIWQEHFIMKIREYVAESHQKGYAPFGKDLAPHYQDYSELHNLAYNAWQTGRDFYESAY